MRAQHGQVVGHGLGVGRAHADIDQRHPQLVFAHQVIGRHLRQRARARGVVGFRAAQFLHHVAGLDKAGVAAAVAAGHQAPAQLDKLVDIALVVGEQHEALEMLRCRAGVVVQPLQGQVHALGGEQRQRPGLARNRLIGAVGDAVVDAAQLGQHERCLQLARLGVADVGGRGLDHERQRDRAPAQAHDHRDPVVAHQPFDLVAVVVRQQVGAGHRGAVHPGVGHRAPGGAAVGDHGLDVDRDPQVRIAGVRGRGQRLAAGECIEARAHCADRGVVDLADARQRRIRVRKFGELVGRMG
ncbi:hypothetical protein D9M72_212090 [compost metagenome]